MTDTNTTNTSEVKCPWCGHEHPLTLAFYWGDWRTIKLDCLNCGKPLRVTRTTTYTTKKVTDE